MPRALLLLLLFAAACTSGEPCVPTCSSDGLTATTCQDDRPVAIACMKDHGQLCEAGACVDPWRYGAPQFSSCASDPHSTTESLADKAAGYDAIATRLHLHPDLGWVLNVTLEGGDPAATWQDVATWHSGENDGLWSALYLTSQAYRFAVTRSEEALATIRTMLRAEEKRMRITGVPGVFTRQLIPPNIAGLSCPTSTRSYARDAEKDDNRWVQIRGDGCAWTVDAASGAWTQSEHCGLDEFADWCWLDNVSKDEYSGHLLALVALFRLVDDPEVQATTKRLLEEVGAHLLANELKIVDWDGRVTEHGRFSPASFDDFPGFNAAMALAYVKAAVEASGRADLAAFHRQCLLQAEGRFVCLGLEEPESFTAHLPGNGLYVGMEGCRSNYNNVSMHHLTLHTLLWVERDPTVRAAIQRSLDEDVARKSHPRAALEQHNALFDFIWAANKVLGPGSDGPALAAVEDGICMLRQFRPSQTSPGVSPSARHQPYCKDRFDRDASQYPREIWERCPGTFVWWSDPYSLSTCTEERREVRQPAGYLLPYWMGRYYGFIGPEL